MKKLMKITLLALPLSLSACSNQESIYLDFKEIKEAREEYNLKDLEPLDAWYEFEATYYNSKDDIVLTSSFKFFIEFYSTDYGYKEKLIAAVGETKEYNESIIYEDKEYNTCLNKDFYIDGLLYHEEFYSDGGPFDVNGEKTYQEIEGNESNTTSIISYIYSDIETMNRLKTNKRFDYKSGLYRNGSEFTYLFGDADILEGTIKQYDYDKLNYSFNIEGEIISRGSFSNTQDYKKCVYTLKSLPLGLSIKLNVPTNSYKYVYKYDFELAEYLSINREITHSI